MARVVRVITCPAESREAANRWIREHTGELRDVAGLERVTFIRSRKPPEVGAVLLFESDDALARFRTTGPFGRIVASLKRTWVGDSEPLRDEAYWVMDV